MSTKKEELENLIGLFDNNVKHNSINFFIPNEDQERYFRSKSKERFVLGSNRSGKSTIGAIEAVSFCLGYRPFLKRTDPDYKTPMEPPVKGLITTESFGLAGTANLVIKEKLKGLIPEGELAEKPKKNQQGIPIYFKFKNGSELYIMAYEQETDKYEGSNFHFWWGDENPPKDKYNSIQRGLTDHDGYYWITTTPISEPWTYDGLFLNDDVEKFMLPINNNVKHKRDWYGYKEECGGLTELAIQSLIRKYRNAHMDEGEIQARITGRFKHLEGLILNNLDPQIHIIKPFPIPKDYTMYVAIDPHPKKPWVILFLACLPNGKMYITKMMFIKAIIEEIVEAILIELNGKKPQKVIIDPYAVMNDPQTGKNMITDIREKSKKQLLPLVASKDKNRGIQMIRSALHYDEQHGEEPTLYFFNTEKDGIRQLMSWVIDDNGKPSKVDDDAGENLYRLMLIRPRYKQPKFDKNSLKDWSQKNSSIAY